MKVFKSLPTDERFFSRYATLTPTLYKLGFLAQVISALTEVGIIYSLIYAGTVEIFPQLALPMAATGAIMGTAFLEIGLRKFVPYGARSILYGRFTGLDAVMSAFILVTCAGLLLASGVLSFRGSKQMVAEIAPPAEQRSTAEADNVYRSARIEAFATFQADSAAIAARYTAQIEARQRAAQSAVDVQRARLKRYEDREKRTETSYATTKDRIREKIEAIEAEADEEIAALEAAGAAEIGRSLEQRRSALKAAQGERTTATAEVRRYNRESKAENAAKVGVYGNGLAWFTVLCIIVFVLSVALKEIHHKGSGIEEKALPGTYQFSPGILAEFQTALSDRLNQVSRSAISRFEAKTAPPPIPTLPANFYDLAGIPLDRIQLTREDPDEQILTLPRRYPQFLKENSGLPTRVYPEKLEKEALDLTEAVVKLEQENNHTAAQVVHLQARDVLRAYLGPKATSENVEQLYQQCIEFHNGQGPNPFEQHHRQPIGFKQGPADKVQCPNCRQWYTEKMAEECPHCLETSYQEATAGLKEKAPPATVTNATVKGGSTGPKMDPKHCLQCGGAYTPRVAWQKYCSKECKEDYHAARHGGQRFNPKKYHRNKKEK